MNSPPFEANQFYHLYTRGNNRENLFKEARNYAYFLRLWARHLHPVVETFAYSLLPNHFHAVIRPRMHASSARGLPTVSKALAGCFQSYAQAINKAYGRRGSLFEEHPKRKLIHTDRYLHNAICYTHTNAQKHGLVQHFSQHTTNSYASILSSRPTLLERESVMAFFDGVESFVSCHQQYADMQFPAEGLLEGEDDDN